MTYQRNRNISVSVSLAEKQNIELAADRAGMSITEWVRTHVLANVNCGLCEEGKSGPGWFTIVDSKATTRYGSRLTGNGLIITFRQDQSVSEDLRVTYPEMSDASVKADFSLLLHALGVECIQNTKQLHGRRIYLPKVVEEIDGRPVQTHLYSSVFRELVPSLSHPPPWA
jgi:hypothetical protein